MARHERAVAPLQVPDENGQTAEASTSQTAAKPVATPASKSAGRRALGNITNTATKAAQASGVAQYTTPSLKQPSVKDVPERDKATLFSEPAQQQQYLNKSVQNEHTTSQNRSWLLSEPKERPAGQMLHEQLAEEEERLDASAHQNAHAMLDAVDSLPEYEPELAPLPYADLPAEDDVCDHQTTQMIRDEVPLPQIGNVGALHLPALPEETEKEQRTL